MKNYIPKGFEKKKLVKEYRRKAENSILIKDEDPKASGLKICRRDNRCGSGLCPICMRSRRKQFLKFASENGFFERNWFLITIRFDYWCMEKGNTETFHDHIGSECINDIPQVNGLLQRFRRRHRKKQAEDTSIKPLLLVGSVETIIRTLDNEYQGKPFHVHLMVAGLSKADIEKCCEKTKRLPEAVSSDYPRPVDIQEVASKKVAVIKALSYSIKQPYWKYSYFGKGMNDRHKQFPNARELYELIKNYGPHECTDRWFKIGFEYRGGSFRLSKMKSKSRGGTRMSCFQSL